MQGGRADWLVEKAAELGAYALRPLVSERVHAAGGTCIILHHQISGPACGFLAEPSMI